MPWIPRTWPSACSPYLGPVRPVEARQTPEPPDPARMLAELAALLERQAPALENGVSAEVDLCTEGIAELVTRINQMDLAVLRERMTEDKRLKGAVQVVLAAAELSRQAARSAQVAIGLRRTLLAQSGVEWYGDRPRVVAAARLNLSF